MVPILGILNIDLMTTAVNNRIVVILYTTEEIGSISTVRAACWCEFLPV